MNDEIQTKNLSGPPFMFTTCPNGIKIELKR